MSRSQDVCANLDVIQISESRQADSLPPVQVLLDLFSKPIFFLSKTLIQIYQYPCWMIFVIWRSSHQRCSVKKYVFKNLTKFTGKHLRQVFSCEFCEIFKSPIFTEHLWTTASCVLNMYNLKSKGHKLRKFCVNLLRKPDVFWITRP